MTSRNSLKKIRETDIEIDQRVYGRTVGIMKKLRVLRIV